MMNRRKFLVGTAALAVSAPAVARALAVGPLTTVDASFQSGTSLFVRPLSEPLNVGDVFTIEGVDAWLRVEGRKTKRSRKFVITAKAEAGQRVIHLYPPIDGQGRYRTVDQLPMNHAEVRLNRLLSTNS